MRLRSIPVFALVSALSACAIADAMDVVAQENEQRVDAGGRDASAALPSTDDSGFEGSAGAVIDLPPPHESTSVVAVLELDGADAESDSLGIRHTLDAFGIPYARTRDVESALRAPEMLVVAGRLTHAVFGAMSRGDVERTALLAWASAPGHTLVVAGADDDAFVGALGLGAVASAGGDDALAVVPAHSLATYANTAEERVIHLTPRANEHRVAYGVRGGAGGAALDAGSTTGADPSSPSAWALSPLGVHADGTVGAAVLENREHHGRVVLFGSSFSGMFTRLEVGLGPASNVCSNAFVPSLDTARGFVRRAYELYTKRPATRAFAPGGKKAAVILTHDIDASSSFVPLRDVFLPVEAARDVKSTLFVTTSYRSTRWISGFYASPENRSILSDALAAGRVDIQSHSVSHSPDFASFVVGVATVDPSNYLPTYAPETGKTAGGAILPELTLSRDLLSQDFARPVRGFRAGYLARPRSLAELEEQVGYAYDATACAGTIGGAFPFLRLAQDSAHARETTVLEWPLSIGDNAITSRTPEETRAIWIDVTTKNADNGAPTVILVHPTNPEQKIQAYTEWLDWALARGDLWIGSLDAYDQWYRSVGIRSEIAAYPF